ncbi:MAG TPA: hypothetical protein VGM90_26670 [Kofleriaceae bacterium]|jgi:hypothetical protein
MTARLASLCLAAVLLSTPACVTTTTTHWPSGDSESHTSWDVSGSQESDHSGTGVVIGVGLLIATAVVIGLVVHANNSTPDEKFAAAPRPAPPHTVIAIAPSPHATDEDMVLQRMFVQGQLSASAGRCEATIAIARRMSVMDPSYYARYSSDPAIANCLNR